MAFRHKPNRGSAFRNDDKDPKNPVDDRKPDFKGSALIEIRDSDGNLKEVEFWVSMWTNPPKDGKKGYFSMAFNEKENTRPSSAPAEDFDEDVPF